MFQRFFVGNVDPAEGNLTFAEKSGLAEMFHSLGISLEESQHFAAPFELSEAKTLGDFILLNHVNPVKKITLHFSWGVALLMKVFYNGAVCFTD